MHVSASGNITFLVYVFSFVYVCMNEFLYALFMCMSV